MSFDLQFISNDTFVNIFMTLLNKHAPIKFKYIRANNNLFMTKELRKAIMQRSKLRNKLNKFRTPEANSAYKKQRNICTSLLRKTKRNYFENLDPSAISDNKKFWKTIKPLFSDKVVTTSKITLCENDEVHDNDAQVAEDFGSFFSKIVTELKIPDLFKLPVTYQENDPIKKAIRKYKNHPSIQLIKRKIRNIGKFSFSPVDEGAVWDEITLLDTSKASPIHSIPPNIIKENLDIFGKKINIDFNASVVSGVFPNNLKYADVSPIFKQGDRSDKSNYRPISILPAMSKVFEKLYSHQISKYMEPYLSIYQCGFRKNMGAQNGLLYLLEKWRKCLDKKGSTGILLTDLSKAFDCLRHDLFLAKLNAYGFDYNSIKLINSYLTGRFQRVRINANYSSWFEILFGVPQGSIMGPLCFNIDNSDLFLEEMESDMSNYADDNTPFSCQDDIESVIETLNTDCKVILEWFCNNGFVANPDKFHFLSSATDKNHYLEVQGNKIYDSNCEKLLGIKIDFKLSFEPHVSTLCRKASQKLHALARISHFVTNHQRRKIMKAFIISHFGYCPLVWMCHSRKLNNRINNIHERSLRIVYNDYSISFNDLLVKDKSVTIHIRNIQTLAIEMYKAANNMSPEIMRHIFPLRESLRYPTKNIFKSSNIKTSTMAYYIQGRISCLRLFRKGNFRYDDQPETVTASGWHNKKTLVEIWL